MLQRLGIRGKILAVVAVPIIVLLLAAGYITLQATNALGVAANAQQLVATNHASQPFQAAFNVERDAAANFVDTFSTGQAGRTEAASSTQTSMQQLQPRDASAYAKVNTIFKGGQEIPGGTALSLDDARAVAPSVVDPDNSDDWYVWPSAEDATQATASLSALADAVAALAQTKSGDTKEILTTIATDLGQESQVTGEFLTVPQTYQATFVAAMGDSFAAWQTLLTQMNKVQSSSLNEPVIAMISTAKDQMRDLGSTRESVRLVSASATTLSQWYEGVTGSVNDMITRSSVAVGDPELSLEVSAYSSIDNVFRQLGLESTVNERIIRNGDYGPGDDTGARNQIAASDFALDDAQSAVSAIRGGVSVPDWGASATTSSDQSFLSVRNAVATGDKAQLEPIENADWVGFVKTEAEAQQPAYDETIALATTRADELHQTALLQTAFTAAAAVLALVATIIIALLIARRIVVPLRRLTTTATAVRAELPRLVERVAMPGETVDVAEVQIPVESQDEVGRLAEAFNGVNAATLAIAMEQAALRGSISEMFVNVARRDQVLLNRQLASIDEMERTQDDPETLTKLFALDHLATRMRRNSESLLVLAGIDTGRRLRRSMPLSDVIRTASSEIELYERVQLELDADPAMLGHSALTAAHLFAELLENATVFSDPGSPVIVRTDERDGLYVVEIQDSGIGMTEAELVEANNRVASTAASEILGAQRLGLFVVGRIARRIGARVAIASTEGEGTVATITMTQSLFDANFAPDVIHHTESTVNEEMHAPAALVTNHVDDEQFEVATAQQTAGAAYQPTLAAGALLASREPVAEPSVEELIAADAAVAPSGAAVTGEELTDGVSPTGLPTRRRRDTAVEVSAEEQKNIIGLPARATAAQLSALDAATTDEEFKPAIPAAELTPQTPEERAQMFRGFRPRREIGEGVTPLDPDAESLGHAARRGGIAPEDIAAQNVDAIPVPEMEDDGFGFNEIAGAAALGAMVIPGLEPDPDEDYYEPQAVEESAHVVVPSLEADESVAENGAAPIAEADAESMSDPEPMVEPALEADPELEPAAAVAVAAAVADESPVTVELEPDPEPEPVFEDATPEPAATPFSYADVYGSLPAAAPEPQPQAPWGVDSVALDETAADTPEPSLDELIAGSAAEKAVKVGVFARLFGRSTKEKVAKPAKAPKPPKAAKPAKAAKSAPVVPESEAPAVPTFEAAPTFEVAPSFEAPPVAALAAVAVAAPAFEAPAVVEAPPVFEAAPVAQTAPVVEAAPVFEPAPVQQEAAPATAESPNPGGAFALWGSQQPTPEAPVFEAPVAGQTFTPDELANPFGWEAAGASALAAAEPEVATEYQPLVDLQPEAYGADDTDKAELTSAAFSEFSSLTTERPKVETTRAGLQRRRATGEEAPEVKPIEPEVQIAHKERDADEIRNRFTSFYSGTQRARDDVAEFEQRSQSTAGKE